MNKPQLSVEMEKRLENWWMDNDPLDFGQLSAFLATALEEQKKEILSEVDGWLDEMPIYMETDGYSGDKPSFAPFRAELRAKLNQLKGGQMTDVKPEVQKQITEIIDEYVISHKGNAQCRCIEGARGHLRIKLFGLFATFSKKHEGAAIIIVCPKCNYPEESCKCVTPEALATALEEQRAEIVRSVEELESIKMTGTPNSERSW